MIIVAVKERSGDLANSIYILYIDFLLDPPYISINQILALVKTYLMAPPSEF